MKHLPVAVASGLVLILWGAEAPSQDPVVQVPPLESWDGYLEDAKLETEAPAKGYLTNRADWAKLWTAWRKDEKVPAVDFKEEIVMVATKAGYSNTQLIAKLKGHDLLTGTFSSFSQAPGQPPPAGFAYHIIRIPRKGIKTIGGKPILEDS